MRRIVGWLIVVMMLALVLYVFLAPASRDMRSDVRAQRKAVAAELETLKDHPWAGKYYAGFARGMYLELDVAPQAGFAYTWDTCTNLQSENYGDVSWNDGWLHLQCKLDAEKKRYEIPATEFVLVRWGQRHYLISLDAMGDFISRIIGGNEPRSVPRSRGGYIFLRDGDWEKPAEGLPELPEDYLAVLREMMPPQDGVSHGGDDAAPVSENDTTGE